METGVKVIDAMTKVPVTTVSTSSIVECAQIMQEHKVGSLLIVDNQKLKGIITEGDIVRRVVANGESAQALEAQDIMSTKIVSLSPDMDIFKAINTMNQFEIRHAPVMFRDDMIGFITLKDILKIQPDLFDFLVENMSVREAAEKGIMERDYASIEPYFE